MEGQSPRRSGRGTSGEEEVSDHVIYAELLVQGCTAELYVNGVPLRRRRSGGAPLPGSSAGPFASIPVQQYLVPGDNRIEILIEPGPTPRRAREPESSMRRMPGAAAVARVVRFEEGAFVDSENGEILAEVKWEGAADEDEAFPKSAGVTAALGARSGRWSWQDAPPITLDDATGAEIAHVLGTVAQAFERGDPAPVLALLKTRFDEGIRAYPRNDSETLTKELSNYVRDAAADKWKVRSLDPGAFDFRLCAGDRLVELVDRDWQPSLRFEVPEEDEPYGYPMMLARIDGRLAVVR